MKTDDVRITSYVLDELEGEARKTFERELAESADLQQAVQKTAKLRDLLNTMSPTTDELTKEQRKSLREECLQNVRIAGKKSYYKTTAIWIGSLATAACIILAFFISTGPVTKSARAKEYAEIEVKEISAENSKQAKADSLVDIKKTSPNAVMDMKVASASAPSSNPVNAYAPLIASISQNPVITKSYDTGAIGQSGGGIISSAASQKTGNVKAASIASGTGRYGGKASDSEGQGGRRVDSDSSSSLAVANQPPLTRAFRSDGYINGIPVVAGESAMDRSWSSKDKPTDESYDVIKENDFLTAQANPLSTFSTDVDTASYSNVRRYIQAGQIPPSDAVRTEELLNYFTYSYPQPEGNVPFSVNIEAARAPWNSKHLLVRIGLKGRELAVKDRPACNLVFLMDVSGSMSPTERLPLLIRCMTTLVENLSPKDHVAIVVYAGSSGIVLPSTSCKDKKTIIEALARLHAGGSTNGAEGIKLAYNVARENLIKDGNNRVILCTDGDFNVGITNREELDKLIEKERTSGVFLSLLGVGTDNLKDATMSHLADKGNGNYAYIDSYAEGRKVLVKQMTGTLFTIAKDVKIQVEFNPAQVAGYRLIGYEKRLLAKEDFNNDKKDAGEIGAGHTVTALYEIVPVGQSVPNEPSVDALKYQKPEPTPEQVVAGKNIDELMTVKLRYKEPDGDTSKLIQQSVTINDPVAFSKASNDFQFASAVAAFGMKLRNSPYHGDLTWSNIQQIARKNMGGDPGSYRAEFITLIEKLHQLQEPAEGAGQKGH